MLVAIIIIFGAVTGALYSLLSRHQDFVSVLMLLGVGGAMVGGSAFKSIMLTAATYQGTLGFSILGALVLMAVFHLAAGRGK